MRQARGNSKEMHIIDTRNLVIGLQETGRADSAAKIQKIFDICKYKY